MKEEVFETRGLIHGSSAPALQTFLRRQPGIHRAEASSMSQSVTVGYDESRISEEQIRALIERCGYHRRGEVLSSHLSNVEPTGNSASRGDALAGHVPPPAHEAQEEGPQLRAGPAVTAPPDDHAAMAHVGHPGAGPAPASTEMAQMTHAMGHGGGMSTDELVRDMRNRFLVAFILAIPVFLYSPLAADTFSLDIPTPFGISNDIPLFVLSTPAVLYGGQVFFVGAYRALRNRILDMSVLVALSVGAGYIFSVAATFVFEAEVSTKRRSSCSPSSYLATGWKCERAQAHRTQSVLS